MKTLTAQPNVKEAEIATKVLKRRSGVTDDPRMSPFPLIFVSFMVLCFLMISPSSMLVLSIYLHLFQELHSRGGWWEKYLWN